VTRELEPDVFDGVDDTRPYQETAGFYAAHRPVISESFVDALVATMRWTPGDRLLDLGSGPAQIARQLAPRVAEVVAVDPEPDMLAEGKKQAAAAGISNITCVVGGSDDLSVLGAPAGQFRAVTIGSAFHWMRGQDRVLRDLDPYLDPAQGAVLIVSWDVDGPVVEVPADVDVRRPWREREPWAEVGRILDRYLAAVPRRPHPRGRHDPFPSIFARSAFPDLQFLRWEYERTVVPSVEAAIGFEYSMSHTLARLGHRRAAFESEVRSALASADPGPVRERVVDSALIARRSRT
jgi:SAM-dependent methyltransferase